MDQEVRTFSVTQYMRSLKNTVEATPAVWVHGVISQIAEKPSGVYLSIADFADGDVKPKATLALYCYTAKYDAILAKISSLSQPFTLKHDLKVNFLVRAELYIPYGKLQAQILDIDPVYTIGELALTKSAILKRLAMEGLLEKNKQLELADVPLRVGLITGENTAAYKDFTTRLEASPFAFEVTTVYARMQGNETEDSIIAALEQLKAYPELDVVCIVRGGGAKTDLNFFDSEALCRAVANYPLPVFTGIGHEIDRCLLDEVAYLSCITPTDCAKRLVERVTDSWNRMTEAMASIADGARELLTENNKQLGTMGNQLQQKVFGLIQNEKSKHVLMAASIKKDTAFYIKSEHERLDRNREGLKQGSRKILDLAKSQFELVSEKVKNADPKTTLAKGYSLTLDANGKFIRKASQLKSGDTIKTRLADGDVLSVVK
jgi:exodeoxyribonuclease VII large subunit